MAHKTEAKSDESVTGGPPPTGRRQGELHESEVRMRLLLESIRDYAIFMLDVNGNVASWNPGAERIKGYKASEIIGRHFSAFYPEEVARTGKCDWELRVAAETGRFEEEQWRVRKDGSQFWASVIISAVRDETGRLIGFAKVTRDLTDRRRAEEERAALAAAEHANRVKDEFLAMLGHELRNPLAPIVTALEILKLRGDFQSTREHVIIERQVRQVVRLVDDLLDVSRITHGKIALKKSSFELAEIVVTALEAASPLLEERRHRLRVDVPREGLLVHGDPVRLAQVVTNLLTNAAKYTEPGGNIAIAASRESDEVVLQVRDDGVGISAELLPRIFETFVQGGSSSARSQGGLGIGLALVRSLVELHGGSVVAKSDGRWRGSTFIVRLPRLGSHPAEDEQSVKARAPARATRPRRILVVDDNIDSATLLADFFQVIGHAVKAVHDAPEALQLAETFRPELAILDIGLPVMDGYELAARMREEIGPACRLVALTGYGQDHDRARSQAAGFAAHLVKPVDPMGIVSLIDELFAGA